MIKSITSLQHPIVKHIVKLRQNRDYRYDHGTIIIEGSKIVTEVCQKIKPKTLIALDETLLPVGIEADEVLIVNEGIMHKISGLNSPEGVLAEIPMPKSASLKGLKYVIAFDGVNDPGNIGTLLRTALALGWEGAFILDESCDPFNEKSLRASRGATFKLPLAYGDWHELKKLIKENALEPVVADLEGQDIADFSVKNGILLVLGNEANGPSLEAKKVCQAVTIPMPGEMESLNVSVAGGIMMYAMRKR